MRNALRSGLACLILLGLVALGGCGQRGPLFLPDEAPVEIRTKPATTPGTAPAAEPQPGADTAPPASETPADPKDPEKRKPDSKPR